MFGCYLLHFLWDDSRAAQLWFNFPVHHVGVLFCLHFPWGAFYFTHPHQGPLIKWWNVAWLSSFSFLPLVLCFRYSPVSGTYPGWVSVFSLLPEEARNFQECISTVIIYLSPLSLCQGCFLILAFCHYAFSTLSPLLSEPLSTSISISPISTPTLKLLLTKFKGESMYPYQEDKCYITLDALKWVDWGIEKEIKQSCPRTTRRRNASAITTTTATACLTLQQRWYEGSHKFYECTSPKEHFYIRKERERDHVLLPHAKDLKKWVCASQVRDADEASDLSIQAEEWSNDSLRYWLDKLEWSADTFEYFHVFTQIA